MGDNLKILITDDQAVFSDTLKESLLMLGYTVFQAFTGETAIDIMHEHKIDVIFLDVFLPDVNGFDLIKKIQTEREKCEIIIMTSYAKSDFIKRSLRSGSYFLPKPFKIEDLTSILKKIEKQMKPEGKKGTEKAYIQKDVYLRSKSSIINNALKQADKYAQSDTTVLISGEKGTGRQKLARYIHSNSLRKRNNFIIFKCNNLPSALLQFHIFGYEKNAFKGANKRKYGLIEIADNSTLYFEDYNLLPLNVQTEIMNFIENKSFRRIGSSEQISANVRIMASIREDAEKAQPDDLPVYKSLSQSIINLPPLKKRMEDMEILIEGILAEYNISYKDFLIDASVLNIMKKYNWPGNIFELEDIISDSLHLTSGKGMFIGNIPVHIITFEGGSVKKDFTLNDIEKQHILNILIKSEGNKAKASRLLGIDRKTLYRKIQKFNLEGFK